MNNSYLLFITLLRNNCVSTVYYFYIIHCWRCVGPRDRNLYWMVTVCLVSLFGLVTVGEETRGDNWVCTWWVSEPRLQFDMLCIGPSAIGHISVYTLLFPESPITIRYALDGSQSPMFELRMHRMGPSAPQLTARCTLHGSQETQVTIRYALYGA